MGDVIVTLTAVLGTGVRAGGTLAWDAVSKTQVSISGGALAAERRSQLPKSLLLSQGGVFALRQNVLHCQGASGHCSSITLIARSCMVLK